MPEITKAELDLLVALKPWIDKAMGPMQANDLLYFPEINKIFNYQFASPEHDNFILIPAALPLPGQDEGRTLVEMIVGFEFIGILHGSWEVCVLDSSHQRHIYHADTPTLALLKALVAQWGVEP